MGVSDLEKRKRAFGFAAGGFLANMAILRYEYFRYTENHHAWGDTAFNRHMGNFDQTVPLTIGVHAAEEVAINVFKADPKFARIMGFMTILATNVIAETAFFAGPNNWERPGDILFGVIGYAFIKLPLLAYMYSVRKPNKLEI